MNSPIKICLLNCCGLNKAIKEKRISSLVLKQRPNTLMLQETILKHPDCPVFKSNWWSSQIQSPGTLKSQGVAILLSKHTLFHMEDSLIDLLGRFLFVKGYLFDTKITIATLYVPNDGQLKFIQSILENLSAFKEGEFDSSPFRTMEDGGTFFGG